MLWPPVLVVPPVFGARQPRPGTQRERFKQSCRRRYHELASRRPKTAIVDWWSDRLSLQSQDMFFDQIHYRHPIAREIENEIAAALARL